MKKNTFKSYSRTSLVQKIIFLIVSLLFFIYACSLMYPLFWGLLSSLKNGALEYYDNPFGLPAEWRFMNYVDAFNMLSYEGVSFVVMIFNSFWFSVGGTLIGLLLLSHFSYVLAKFKFPGCNLIVSVSIIIMIIPVYGSMPATYSFYNLIRITNSPLILVIFTGIMGGNQFLITKSFYANLQKELSEAAKVDGANDWVVYFKIMMPLARGILLAFFLTNFIAHWNDYMTPLLYLSNMPTLATGLYKYQTIVERSGNFPLYYAGCAIAMVPIAILYGILNKKLIENLSFGGLKG